MSRQEVFVKVTGNRASVELIEDGAAVASFDGFAGRNGAVEASDKREGDGKTPIGVFDIGTAFGSAEVSTKMPFRAIGPDDVWVDDPDSAHYNTRQARGGDWKSAEDMLIWQYEFGFVIEYNTRPPVAGMGSAIFMHVNDKPTAGCIAVARDDMRRTLEWLDPAKVPVIMIIEG